jgi:hypothetical protein
MRKMLKFLLVIGSLIMLLWPIAARGQYVGGSRPWSNQRMADSLAKKADTTRVKALEARHAADSLLKADSLAAHAARIAARPDSSKFKGFQKFYTSGTLDSLKPAASGSMNPDSFPFSYVIGRGTGGNENYSATNDSLLIAGLKAGFAALASTGGTIFLKGNNWVLTQTDTLPSTSKTIIIKGEEGRTKIYYAGGDYCFYDTLNAGKLWLGQGLEWIGTANSLGIIRTGTTGATSGDSAIIKENIFRNFTSTSSQLFATDDSTNDWLIKDCRVVNCYQLRFDGGFSKIFDVKCGGMLLRGVYLNADNNIVESCEINVPGTGQTGIEIARLGAGDSLKGTQVINNRIYFSAFNAANTGIWANEAAAADIQCLSIVGNRIDGKISLIAIDSIAQWGIIVEGGRSSIQSNFIRDCKFGIYLNGSGTGGGYNNVSGNHCIMCKSTGIYIQHGQTNAIISNYISYAGINGINIISGCIQTGHSENFFRNCATNVTDNGTSTVAGDIRDIE